MRLDKQLHHSMVVNNSTLYNQRQTDVLSLHSCHTRELVSKGDINPVMQIGRDVVTFKCRAVLSDEICWRCSPRGNIKIGQVRMDRLEACDVGKELGDAAVRRPEIHALHGGRILVGHPLGAHVPAQHILGRLASKIHKVRHLSKSIGDMMRGNPFIERQIQLRIAFVEPVLAFTQVSPAPRLHAKVHYPWQDGVIVGVAHPSASKLVERHYVVKVAGRSIDPASDKVA